MSPSQRILTWLRRLGTTRQKMLPAVVLGLVVIAVVGISVWKTRPQRATREWLLGGHRFSDSQLAQMAQAFASAKLTDYTISNRRVAVPAASQHKFLASLAEHDALPRDFQAHTDAAMSQQRWMETDRDRQSRIQHAREKDLALAIRSMRGIQDAMVQYDETERSGFQRERVLTASVAVMPADGHVLDRQQIRTIRHLVAWAKAGLKSSEVNVTDLRSGRAYVADGEETAPMPLAEEYLQVKRSIESQWESKVRQVLRYVPRAQVVVDIDLGQVSTTTHDAEPMAWARPERIAISVGVPEGYARQVWAQQHPASGTSHPSIAGDDWKSVCRDVESQIQTAVGALLPQQATARSAVAVTIFPESIATLPGSLDQWNQQILPWLRSHRLEVIGSLGVVLIVAWSLWMQAQSRAKTDTVVPSLRAYPDGAEAEDTDPNPEALAEELELRAQLVELVRQDPEHAARVFHRWIERAG